MQIYLEQRICQWREEAGTWAAEQPSKQETLKLEDAEQAVHQESPDLVLEEVLDKVVEEVLDEVVEEVPGKFVEEELGSWQSLVSWIQTWTDYSHLI